MEEETFVKPNLTRIEDLFENDVSVKFSGDSSSYESLLDKSLEDPHCLRRFACELKRSSQEGVEGSSVKDPVELLLHHLYL